MKPREHRTKNISTDDSLVQVKFPVI